MTKIPDFAEKSKLFEWLIENKSLLISQKTNQTKHGDVVTFSPVAESEEFTVKAISTGSENPNKIEVVSVINTTNLRDGHGDVHFPGIWSKSIKETKGLYLLEEHKMSFRGIISDEVKASAKTISWKELGFNYDGTTQALVFNTKISKDRNEYMFEQYRTGRVKNHSVGMRYVKIALALDDDRYELEKKEWDKRIGDIVNQEDTIAAGYFWSVTEAKVIEGSAVPMGSNWATPTLSVTDKDIEPLSSTHAGEGKTNPKKTTHYFLTH